MKLKPEQKIYVENSVATAGLIILFSTLVVPNVANTIYKKIRK